MNSATIVPTIGDAVRLADGFQRMLEQILLYAPPADAAQHGQLTDAHRLASQAGILVRQARGRER